MYNIISSHKCVISYFQYSDSPWAARSGDQIQMRARFATPIQTGLGPSQPPTQWVLGLCQG